MTQPKPGAADNAQGHAPTRRPRTVRIPGFVPDEPVGLGDAIKRATTLVGIKPCGGCAERAAMLNSRVQFMGRRR